MYNILVVEDEEFILKLMNIRLTKSGYNVFLAENGLAALNILYSNKYDLKLNSIPFTDIFRAFNILKHTVNSSQADIIYCCFPNVSDLENPVLLSFHRVSILWNILWEIFLYPQVEILNLRV